MADNTIIIEWNMDNMPLFKSFFVPEAVQSLLEEKAWGFGIGTPEELYGAALVLYSEEQLTARLPYIFVRDEYRRQGMGRALINALAEKASAAELLSLEADAAFRKEPELFNFLLNCSFIPTGNEYSVYAIKGKEIEEFIEEQEGDKEKPNLPERNAPRTDVKPFGSLTAAEKKKLYAKLQKSYLSFDPEGWNRIEPDCSMVYVPKGEPKAVVLIRNTNPGCTISWVESEPNAIMNMAGALWSAILKIPTILDPGENLTIVAANIYSEKVIKDFERARPSFSGSKVRYTSLTRSLMEERAAASPELINSDLNLFPRFYGIKRMLDDLSIENELYYNGVDMPILYLFPTEEEVIAWSVLSVDSERGYYLSTLQTYLEFPEEKREKAEAFISGQRGFGMPVQRILKPKQDKIIISTALPEGEEIPEIEVVSFLIRRLLDEYRAAERAVLAD